MENSLPKLSLEPRIGSAPFEVNEPDGSEKHMPKLTPSEKLEIQVRKIHEQRQFKSLTLDSLTNIENEEEKDIEENKVEKSFASKGVDLLKMHDTVTNNI
ncbi:subunit 17 of mediator complex-domain-containing protein, partial [Gigaspora margarita]